MRERHDPIPLCIDLDGTLTPIDTLHESLLALAKAAPASLAVLPAWLSRGRATLKREIADRVAIDAASLPWNEPLLAWLREQRAAGRWLVLATAAERRIADAVAGHLGLFDEVLATEAGHNLSGAAKRDALVARYGERGYDYAGNDDVDLAVWSSARQAIVVGDAALAARAAAVAGPGPVFAPPAASGRSWVKAMRLYQWVKNLLIFLPAVLGHQAGNPAVLVPTLLAFLAFGLCASSVYLFNDLFDLSADRRHARKRLRPFASGVLSARSGVIAGGVLFVATTLIAVQVGWMFCAVLALYYACTWAYSLRLKRTAIVDVMMLAGLYTIRIVAGAAATGIALSFWLLAFSMFLFLSLAIVKRYAELHDAARAGRTAAAGRGYSAADLPLLLALGTASGIAAVVVLALYISSPDSAVLYTHERPLWLICPLLLYWISRVWLLTTRGEMHDDPILFAIRDRASLALVGVISVLVAIAV